MTKALAALALLAATSVPPHAHAETFRTTAYCLNGPTRSGEWTRPGVVAVDPRIIPLYSLVSIEGLGDGFEALDTGGGVLGNHVDIWFGSCERAVEYGVRYRDVTWSPA